MHLQRYLVAKAVAGLSCQNALLAQNTQNYSKTPMNPIIMHVLLKCVRRQSNSALEDRALALNILSDVGLKLLTLHHRAGVGGGWSPLGRGTGGSLLHHLVDLLKRKTLEMMLAHIH